ncbi:LamG-like jellyroll fold [Beggiatoa sp. PS]|nr:LamG-like jellyroll fold [Beggiatoa sp. PS]
MKKRLGMALVVFLPLLMARPVLADLNEGLMGYWPFNGNANDESGNGNTGTVHQPTLTEDRFGNPNSAYEFDGDDRITVLSSKSLHPVKEVSIAFWVKVYEFENEWTPLIFKGRKQKDSRRYREYIVFLNKSGIFYIGSLEDCCSGFEHGLSTNPVNAPKEWIFYTAVIDRENHFMKVYINGKLNAQTSDPNSSFQSNDFDLEFGGNAEGHDTYSPLNGVLDDIRLYNRVLSDEEIQELYGEFIPGPTVFTQADVDIARTQGYESGKQACINNPRSCGIEGEGTTSVGAIVPVCNGSVCGDQWPLPLEPTDAMGYIPIDRFRPEHGNLWHNPLMFQPAGGTFSDSSGAAFDTTRFEPNWVMNAIEGLFQVRYACQASWYSGAKNLDWIPANIVGAIEYCVYPAKIPEVVNHLRSAADNLACVGGMESCQ